MAVITMIEAPKVDDEPSWGSHQGAGRIASPEEWAAKQFSGGVFEYMAACVDEAKHFLLRAFHNWLLR